MNPPSDLVIRRVDLQSEFDQQAVLDLLNMYACEPTGDGQPLSKKVRETLIPKLQEQTPGRHFIALHSDRPIAIAICFLGFSTFYARSLMNVHDLAVVPEYRGQKIGEALLSAVEEEAIRNECCRMTLEVRVDNIRAQKLYERFGFSAGESESKSVEFWSKPLES